MRQKTLCIVGLIIAWIVAGIGFYYVLVKGVSFFHVVILAVGIISVILSERQLRTVFLKR